MSAGPWRGIAAHGLPGARARPPRGPHDDPAFERLSQGAERRRLGGLLLAAVETGQVLASEDQREALLDRRAASLARELRLERALLETADVLDRVRVPIRVLKGPAAARLDYADPAMRSFGDIDVLVRESDVDIALGALLASGHRRRHPEPRPGFDHRFAKGVCVVRADGTEIDVHRSLVGGAYGVAIPASTLWSGGDTFELGGRALRALGPVERFAHAALHATLGSRVPPLHTLRDLAQLALVTGVDIDAVDDAVRTWRATAVVRRAVLAAWAAFELPAGHPVERWAARLPVTGADDRAIAAYQLAEERFAATSIAALRQLPAWADRARYAWALAFPTRAYLAAQGTGRLTRLRRAARVVRAGRR